MSKLHELYSITKRGEKVLAGIRDRQDIKVEILKLLEKNSPQTEEKIASAVEGDKVFVNIELGKLKSGGYIETDIGDEVNKHWK